MTNVFIDHQKFSTQRYGGISRYFASVMDGLRDSTNFSYKLGVLHSQNHYLRHESLPLNKGVSGRLIRQKESVGYRINELYCKQLLTRQDFDVFHPTYYNPYFLKSLRKPLVITIHDMTYERLPEYFWAQDPLTHQKRLNIERADAIIAISNTTRTDLISLFDVDPDKIHVIYHGIDTTSPLVSQPVANLPENYLLYVGDRSGYKNFYLFLNAFKELHTRYPDLNVVLTGGGSMAIADREFVHRLGLQDWVHHVNATDQELNFLYRNALSFVYPSLYEGFGLPILEAFRTDCPMVLSDTDCFREVAADAATYFSPTSLDDLIGTIDAIITDTELRKKLVESGKKRLNQFPLSESVAQTLNVYKALN
ncbi:glycosyltransferase family 4 protein [Spirosoma agri]|uniref:Glycosyltransferase family 4 protein n=1 Tax=Spirosoma agri TaxID=1987381 RepID=A0A6M0IQA9_9BACT|nr:glycosyltransferase family 1 protein [Spirosoma agri]NEU70466.1 glycosyltransferase family 4 protein [Spirosoma agri]